MNLEIKTQDLITYEYQPNGGKLPILDPYDGCTLNCPYCFQYNDPDWNENILIKSNIHQLIKPTLQNWPKDQTIYIGSRCDPYMLLEDKHCITRNCLKELNDLGISCMIITKSATGTVERDLDLIQHYSGDLTMIYGISNLGQLSRTPNSWEIKNITIINRLHELGIKVWAFITPILPGITDVEKIIDHLHTGIPVFLDKLRLEPGARSTQNMLTFIQRKYPNLKGAYEQIINQGTDPYCEALRKQYENNPRVKFAFT